jgi:hypothetical protein
LASSLLFLLRLLYSSLLFFFSSVSAGTLLRYKIFGTDGTDFPNEAKLASWPSLHFIPELSQLYITFSADTNPKAMNNEGSSFNIYTFIFASSDFSIQKQWNSVSDLRAEIVKLALVDFPNLRYFVIGFSTSLTVFGQKGEGSNQNPLEFLRKSFVVCFHLTTGAVLWSNVYDGSFDNEPTAATLAVTPSSSTLYVAGYNIYQGYRTPSISALDVLTGKRLWKKELPECLLCLPRFLAYDANATNLLLASIAGGSSRLAVSRLSLSTGSILSTVYPLLSSSSLLYLPAESPPSSAPAVTHSNAFPVYPSSFSFHSGVLDVALITAGESFYGADLRGGHSAIIAWNILGCLDPSRYRFMPVCSCALVSPHLTLLAFLTRFCCRFSDVCTAEPV